MQNKTPSTQQANSIQLSKKKTKHVLALANVSKKYKVKYQLKNHPETYKEVIIDKYLKTAQ